MASDHAVMPWRGDPLGRYLPWLAAFMVFVAALALAALFIVHDTAAGWERVVHGTLTVRLPPASALVPPAASSGAPAAEHVPDDAVVTTVLEALRATPGVRGASFVGPEEMLESLSPWLDGIESAAQLPLPRLIEVEADPGAIDISALRQRLRAFDPAIVVDDHGELFAALGTLSGTVQMLAAAIVAAIAVVTAGAVIVATLTGLGIHRDTIEILHLIGARDRLVAGQFAGRAWRGALIGGAAGAGLAVAGLVVVLRVAAAVPEPFRVGVSLDLGHWIALAALPIAIGLLSMATTWVTVMRTLAARF